MKKYIILLLLIAACKTTPQTVQSGDQVIETYENHYNTDDRNFEEMSQPEKDMELNLYANDSFNYTLSALGKNKFRIDWDLHERNGSFLFETKISIKTLILYYLAGFISATTLLIGIYLYGNRKSKK